MQSDCVLSGCVLFGCVLSDCVLLSLIRVSDVTVKTSAQTSWAVPGASRMIDDPRVLMHAR